MPSTISNSSDARFKSRIRAFPSCIPARICCSSLPCWTRRRLKAKAGSIPRPTQVPARRTSGVQENEVPGDGLEDGPAISSTPSGLVVAGSSCNDELGGVAIGKLDQAQVYARLSCDVVVSVWAHYRDSALISPEMVGFNHNLQNRLGRLASSQSWNALASPNNA